MTIAPIKIGIVSPGSISGCLSNVFGSVYNDGFDKNKIMFELCIQFLKHNWHHHR
mgnify:CR=1 FL=1